VIAVVDLAMGRRINRINTWMILTIRGMVVLEGSGRIKGIRLLRQ
jgi:hypothetical protein